MELSEIKSGVKVAYLGACFVIGKVVDDGVLIYPARRSMYGHLPSRAVVKPADLVAWTGKQPSKHARHCQICGRLIFAQTGVIAHHGYERPGDGYQTESCYGARFQSFEVNRDRLGWYIEKVAKPELARLRARRLALDAPGVEVPGPYDIARLEPVDRSKRSYFERETHQWVYDVRDVGPNYDRRVWKWPFAWAPSTTKNTVEDRVLSQHEWEHDRKGYDDYLSAAKDRADRKVASMKMHVEEQQKRFDTWKPVKQ